MIKAPFNGPDGRTPPVSLLQKGLSRMAVVIVAGGLAGCSSLSLPGGFDLINGSGQTDAGRQPTAPRPEPDARGVISYPNYQVAVARDGDTVVAMADRLGVGADALANANGLTATGNLRAGELLLLPSRVATTAPSGSLAAGGEVDVATLAGSALDRAEGQPASTAAQTAPATPTGTEPRRHTVERGETAFSIARLYSVSARAIGDWNGLNSALDVREGQVLLIPVATGPALGTTAASAPGTGSVAPEPPSAAAPQPAQNLPSVAGAAAGAAVIAPTPTPAPQTDASDSTRLLQPVSGQIIRGYNPGRNEGVDFGTAPSAPVRAADAGTVAAITRDTEQVQIIVLRHADGVLTVYANVDDIIVEKGTSVARGQRIASVNSADPSFLHFEVLQGSQRVDPVPFLTP